jgi:hypothetical protein
MSSTESSVNLVDENDVENLWTKPEDFCFAVETMPDGNTVVLCPIETFKNEGYLDDGFFEEIENLMMVNGYHSVMEGTYECEDESLSTEAITAKMLELGFKQLPEFDKFISETTMDFSNEALLGEPPAEEFSVEEEPTKEK